MFHQLESLPIAYFTVLMWVVCANVLAKLIGPLLIDLTSGWLRNLLSRRVNMEVTADGLALHLFEERLLLNVNTRLFITLMSDLARMIGAISLLLVAIETFALKRVISSRKYWSGCPPNSAYSY